MTVVGDDGRRYESSEHETRVLRIEAAAPDMLEALKHITECASAADCIEIAQEAIKAAESADKEADWVVASVKRGTQGIIVELEQTFADGKGRTVTVAIPPVMLDIIVDWGSRAAPVGIPTKAY